MGANGPPLVAVAKGLPGSKLRRVVLEELVQNGIGDELADQVDAWVSEFAATVARQIEPRPRPDLLLDPAKPEEPLDAGTNSVVSTRPGGVLWALSEESAEYLGTEELEKDGTGLVPLTSDTWLTIRRPSRVTGISSRDLNRQGRLLQALAEFHRLATGAERLNRLLSLADEANEQTDRAAHRRMDEQQARESLFNVLGPARPVAQEGGSLSHGGSGTDRSARGHRLPFSFASACFGRRRTSPERRSECFGRALPKGAAVVGRQVVGRRQRRYAGFQAR